MELVELQKKIIPQITDLLKKEPDSIMSVEKTKEGWIVVCDVLEKKSVPETFDLLKVFEFSVDNNAKIIGFKQVKKIRRGDLN
ncbi:MAG: gas vesicle protein GvpO [Nanoarchaeota archaeon]